MPIEHVIETMRPLPIEPLGHAPDFVRGVAIIRGRATPVIDTARLLDTRGGTPTRFVTLRAGARSVALTFDAVVEVRRLDRSLLAELPPLLGHASREVVAAVGVDPELLVVLEASRAIPADTWAALESA